MTDEQRSLLHNLLMSDMAKQAQPGTTEWKIYDESVTEDILKMEPLIDIFICNAKLQAITDFEAKLRKRVLVAIASEKAPLETKT